MASERRPSRMRVLVIALGVLLGIWAISAVWLLGTAWYSVPSFTPASVPAEVARIPPREAYDKLASSSGPSARPGSSTSSRAASIPTYSWEPPDAAVIRSVLDQGFPPEQVALRWILNPYFSNLRHGRPDDPEAFVNDTLDERAGFLGEMDLNQPRDEHLVACITELVRASERVFVICGSSHAVKIEPALAELFVREE